MAEEPFFNLEINKENLLAGIEVIDEAIIDTEENLEELEKAAKIKIRTVINMARLGWGIMQGMIRAAGGAISMTTRLAVSATFGAIAMLYPIISAGGIAGFLAGDPTKIAASLTGFAQLATALTALVAYESGQKDLSLQLRGLNFTFQNVGMMFSGFSII